MRQKFEGKLQMLRFSASTSLLVLMLALSQSPVQAEDIKDLVSDSQLAEFCSSAGVGSETTATVTFPDGTTATGTIHCEAEDRIVGGDDSPDDDDPLDGDSEDDDTGDDDSEDDGDTGDDDGSDDDSGDDDSDDDSGDDDSGDDDNSDESDDE